MSNLFIQRKKDVLGKEDKSSIGGWDKYILELCGKINSMINYYTTSSCAGRVVLIIDQDKKAPGLFDFVSHEKINFKILKNALDNSKNKNLKFKQESCILHVACEDLESAQNLLEKGRNAGWKRSGIISSEKRFIVELNGTNKLEFPIMNAGKVLVDDEFLKLIVKKSNKNLEKGWTKIEDLKSLLD